MHGFGQLIWPDGAKYIGEFSYGVKDGYGEYYYPNGKVYKG